MPNGVELYGRTAERSFRKLTLIKSYLRSRPVLSVESELVDIVKFEELVEQIAASKTGNCKSKVK